MARSVCFVLLIDPRVRNVCGDPFFHETYCLRRAYVAFFRGYSQLTAAQWLAADRVEVRFRGSKGDQLRKGAVVTRVRVGPPRRMALVAVLSTL